MIVKEETINSGIVLDTAKKMLIAARTAPKGKGVDTLTLAIIKGQTLKKLAKKMKEMGQKHSMAFFIRDAANVLQCPCIVLLGTKISALGIKKCGLCGFKDCKAKNKHSNVPCAFNTGDLGIALGSAVSIAADNRIDNRIMFTAGAAAVELGLLGKNVKIAYGVALAAKSKNPFFDRTF